MTTIEPSDHFSDFAPVLTAGPAAYPSILEGPGRWFVIVAPSNHLVGMLWTGENGGLGLIRSEQTSPAHANIVSDQIAHAAELGVPADVFFDMALATYGENTQAYGAGQLEDLLAEFDRQDAAGELIPVPPAE